MKRAIAYIRISVKDQSNFSTSAQLEHIKAYCERKGIILVTFFEEKGQSAKNFDRANWKVLEAFIKANHRTIDYLIVCKYDRFSRNLVEGLAMIEKFESKYSIEIHSVFEEIAISRQSPFFFKMRTDMLVQAEFELRVIRERTKTGIDEANRQGRYVNMAPYGYVNQRVGDNKKGSRLVVNPEAAVVVKKCFELFSAGMPIVQVGKYAREHGCKLKGRSAMQRMLTNPIYCGLIRYKDGFVNGIHEPIVGHDLFNRVQTFFKQDTKTKVVINDDVPLRGVLRCSCRRNLTAGKSKGKKRYYWYYKCLSHLDINLNADFVHERLGELLEGLSLNREQIDDLKARTQTKLKAKLSERGKKLKALNSELSEAITKQAGLEEKFFASQITHDVYSRWNITYKTSIDKLNASIAQLNADESLLWDKFNSQAGELKNMRLLFNRMHIMHKQRLIKLVFNDSLRFQLNTFLADYLIPEFRPNELELNKKGLLIISNPYKIPGENSLSTQDGTLFELLALIKESQESVTN